MIQKIMIIRDEVDELICQARDIQHKLGSLLADVEKKRELNALLKKPVLKLTSGGLGPRSC